MESTHKQGLNRLILVLDTITIVLCAVLAFILHPAVKDHIAFIKDPIELKHYITLVILWIPIWLGFVVALGLHRVFDKPQTRSELFWGIVKLHLLCLLALSALLFLTQLKLNRSLVILFFINSFLLMYGFRSIILFRLNYQYRHGHGQKNILLVGDPSEPMADFINNAQSEKFPPLFLGRLGTTHSVPPMSNSELNEPKLLGPIENLEDYLHEQAVDQVVFFSPWNNPENQKKQLDTCELLGVQACFSVDMEQPSQSAPRFSIQFEKPFILFDIAPKRPDLLAIKHAQDAIGAFIGLVLLSPILLVTALLILITMGKPIFFFQKRAGLFGKEFKMIKFRTMRIDAEKKRNDLLSANEMSGPVFKVTGDPRITKLGHFLRRWSIDELPQLINVLSGTMSLVGPRPLPIQEQQEIKGWKRRRLSMKPGISGLWQVSGRSDIDFENWMKLDLKYIDNWSLKFDMKILLKTINAVIGGKGAR